MASETSTSATTPNTAGNELIWLSATELARRIRTGEVSSREATEVAIARIQAVNAKINAVVFPMFELARAAAQAADEAQAHGEELALLHGVPITIKDQFDVQGAPSTWGVTSRARVLAEADGPIVARLRHAGGIILGKTNVPQLLFYAESDNPVYGTCRNPWNQDRVPGGSSGGEGAILAAGGSYLGMGGDIGGSLRVPAHFNGIATIKPTSPRLSGLDNPRYFANGQEAIIAQIGPMARTIADVVLGLQIMAAPGMERLDPRVPPVPLGDPQRVTIAGMRVAMYEDDGFFPASPAVRRAVREAATVLQAQGAIIEPWTPPDVTHGMMIFAGLLGADGGRNQRQTLAGDKPTPQLAALFQVASLPRAFRPLIARLMQGSGQRRTAQMVQHIRPLSAADYWDLILERTRYRDGFLAALDAGKYDAILCPPHALPALIHGATVQIPFAASYSMIYNLLEMPAGVVPVTRVRPSKESERPRSRDSQEIMARRCDEHSAGLPVGVQVVAHHWREDIVLALLAAIEAGARTTPDFPQHPPI